MRRWRCCSLPNCTAIQSWTRTAGSPQFCSWHLQLSLQLALQGSLSIWFGHLLVALPAYPFLVSDYATVLSLFTHHQWIGGFFIVGGAAHASMALIFDCNLREHPYIAQVMTHKNTIVVHLNWVCIFLGFHSFGLYIHNDTVAALGRGYDQFSDQAIVLAPLFARWIQAQLVEPSLSVLASRVAGRVFGLGTADTLVHHVHAFTIHVTALILLKGSLYARSSRLVPDKASIGFRPHRYLRHLRLRWILPCRLLDAQYRGLDHLLLALEALGDRLWERWVVA